MPFGSFRNPRPIDTADAESESADESSTDQANILPSMSSDGDDSAVAGLTALGGADHDDGDDDSEFADAALDREIRHASTKVDRAVLSNSDHAVVADQLPVSMSATSILTGEISADDNKEPREQLPVSMSATSILTGEISAAEMKEADAGLSPIPGSPSNKVVMMEADEIPARAEFPSPYKVDPNPVPLKNKDTEEKDSSGKGAAVAVGAVAVAGAAAAAAGATAAAMGGVRHEAGDDGKISVFGEEGSKTGAAGTAATVGLGAAAAAAAKKQREEADYFKSDIFEKIPITEQTANMVEADTTPKIRATFPAARGLDEPNEEPQDVQAVLEPARKIGDYELPEMAPGAATVSMTENPIRGAPETPKSIRAVRLSDEARKERQGKLCKIGAFVVLALIILAVGLGLGLREPPVEDTMAPTAVPVPGEPTAEPVPDRPTFQLAPTASPAPTQSAFDILRLYLASISPDGGAALEDPSSPQYQAAEWLFTNPRLSTYSETQINQRYALATVYLSTDGDNWRINNGWMGPVIPECQWVGVGCETALETAVVPPSRRMDGISTSTGLRSNDRRTQETMMVVKKVQLFELGLSGPFPSEIAILTDTIDISAYGNSITGTIPDAIADITGLEIFQLDANLMTGTIPAGMFDLVELTKVRLESNAYTGTLPATIGQLTKVEKFRIDNNMMAGSLPEEVGDMAALVELWVNGNMFTGTVPESLGMASAAEEMYFHDNELTGVMPTPICDLAMLVDLTSDCGGDPPEVECSCCTQCYPLVR